MLSQRRLIGKAFSLQFPMDIHWEFVSLLLPMAKRWEIGPLPELCVGNSVSQVFPMLLLSKLRTFHIPNTEPLENVFPMTPHSQVVRYAIPNGSQLEICFRRGSQCVGTTSFPKAFRW